MVNILTYANERGDLVHINAVELQTKEGREWLKERLEMKKGDKAEEETDTNSD